MPATEPAMPFPEEIDSPYLSFDRDEWAKLRPAVPVPLTEDDLEELRGINEDLSLQ